MRALIRNEPLERHNLSGPWDRELQWTGSLRKSLGKSGIRVFGSEYIPVFPTLNP